MFYKINKVFSNPNLKLLFLTIFFFILFNISLLFRGIGWDGDSIVNIHQFYKIINQNLYNGPDGGTTPKFFPILLFGVFHYVFNSYSIHFIVFIICSYAFAKSTLLNKRLGGGYIWFILPFTSPFFLNDVMSANNPALSMGFYILSLVFLFEKKIIFYFIFLLFSEFSRPGYSILMLISFLFLLHINYSDLKQQTIKIFFTISLVVIGFIHSFYCYKLGYASFEEYMDQNWAMYSPEYKLTTYYLINNKFETILIFFKGAITAIFSNILFPFPITILVIFLLLILFKKFKHITTIIFFLPVIYLPMLYSGLTMGAMPTSETATLKLLPNFDRTMDSTYFITILPILMFAVSINFNKFILKYEAFLKNKQKTKILNCYFKILICFKNPIIFAIIALILSPINGILFKNRFDYNPPNPKIDKNHFWYSSNLSQKIFKEVYSKKKGKLKILIACDLIPILIDNALLIEKADLASIDLKYNHEKKEYIRLCAGNWFKKRQNDILLAKINQLDIFENYDYDLIYITKDIKKIFKLPVNTKIIHLKHERLIIINDKYK